MIKDGENLKELTGSVKYSSGFTPTEADKNIEESLGNLKEGVFPEKIMLKLLKDLSSCTVYLDGKEIEINKKAVGLQAHIKDEASGIHIIGKLDPRIDKLFKNGLATVQGSLHPAPTPNLSQGEMKLLKLGRFFAASELNNFVAGILPSIEEEDRSCK